MRALEWALVMTQLAAAAALAWPAQRDARLRLGWAALLAGLLVLQPVLEGYRWQLLGLYAGSVLLAGSQLLRGRRLLAGSSLALLALLSAAPPLLFPVPQLMPPTGRYAVGVTSFAVTDPVRKEIYSNNALDARAVLVQVWYPAVPAPGAQRGPWLENVEQLAPMISRAIKMPDFLLDHLKYGTANSYPNAPIISTPALLPVVHFSHGWDSFRTQSTFLMEELASQGYVVVSTEHPYGAVGTIMPDGRVLQHNRAILPRGAPADVYHAAAMRQAGQWVGDTQLVLGTCARCRKPNPQTSWPAASHWTAWASPATPMAAERRWSFAAAARNAALILALTRGLIPCLSRRAAPGSRSPHCFSSATGNL